MSLSPSDYFLAGSVLLSILAMWRSNKQESRENWDQRIDERIDLKLGPDMAVVKSTLLRITDALTNNANLVQNTVDATLNAVERTASTMLQIRNVTHRNTNDR